MYDTGMVILCNLLLRDKIISVLNSMQLEKQACNVT